MAPSTTTRLLKFSMFIKRKSDITEDEFHKYWTEKHVPVVDKWLAKHGVIRYIQYHLRSEVRSLSETVWTAIGGDSVLEFDGQVELLVPSIECLQNALNDPYYKEHVQKDEEKFIDGSKSSKTVGWEEMYIVDGAITRKI
ncbi:hypothetical protein N0V94_004204 [Neodidymelliopsis sp. IMI 364377]|nr:hypothetical protein N0V94_004204 [Neodidymelliopsis sp. IMI 364377]